MTVYEMIKLPIYDYLKPFMFPLGVSFFAAISTSFIYQHLDGLYLKLFIIVVFGVIYMASYWIFKYDFIHNLMALIFKRKGGDNK